MEWPQKNTRRGKDPAFFDVNGDTGVYEHAYDNGAYYYQSPPVHTGRYPGLFSSYPYNGHGSWTRSSGKRNSDNGDSRSNRRCLLVTFVLIAVLVVMGIIGAVIAVVVSNRDSDSSTASQPVVQTPVLTKNYTGQATLKDIQFTEDFNNPESAIYRQTEQDFIYRMRQELTKDGSPFKDSFVDVVVKQFIEGSVIVRYAVITTTTVEDDDRSNVLKEAVESMEIVERNSVEVADTSACDSDPCLNGATCIGVESYSCVCVSGYTGTNCENEIDECASNPCENGGSCIDHLSYYTCSCVSGFSGLRCGTNIDECQSDPCKNDGSCIDGVSSYTCDCGAGYTGILCETDINECASAPCENEGVCNNGVNMYSCTCTAGFTGVNCQTNINECQSAPCLNGGTCNDELDSYTCTCDVGYTGLHCEINVDECESDPCENGADCVDGIGSYACACLAGYTGILCQTNINECQSNPCQHGGLCTDDVDFYTCTCMAGYTGNNCQTDIQECTSDPCMHGGSCTDQVNSYSCTCAPGYTGTNCETNKNECESNPCMHGGTCNDGVDMYTCTCMSGYTGMNCQTNINECGSNPCWNGGSCTDRDNFYICDCLDGFMGDNCEINIDDCQVNPCQNGGACIDGINSITCDCRPGYTGTLCQTNVNECGSNSCRNGGSCTDKENYYACTYLPGFMGDSCEIDINECQINPCHNGGSCIDEINTYTCVCPPGYTGTLCQTESSTSEPSPEPTYEPLPETTHTPTASTTPTPFVDFNCSAGYEKLEIWVQLPYAYSQDLQDRSSDEFGYQASYVYQLISIVNSYDANALDRAEIVYFQNWNESSVSTVLTCLVGYSSDTKYLYYLLTLTADASNTVFLGLQRPYVYFTCTSLLCIPDYFVCDNQTDCSSGVDESSPYCNVSSVTTPGYTSPNTTSVSPSPNTYPVTSSTTPNGTLCGFNEYTCADGTCIPSNWECDRIVDCVDLSDEIYCIPEICSNDEFECNVLPWCIPNVWVCDGDNDCKDNSDEVVCEPTTTAPPITVDCGDDEHQCHDNKACVNKSLRCDGNYDCNDRSDEWFCPMTPVPRPAGLEIRLMNGENDTTSQIYGRVEVRPIGSNATFGTICDDMWGTEEAEVICRQLGYINGNAYAYKGAWFGMGTGPIYLGNMRCTGEEADLMECESTAEWGYIHCAHNQDASVSCGFELTTSAPPTTTSVSTTTEPVVENIKLIGGDSCLSGLVQVTINGEVGTVCDDFFSKPEADVTCRSLGFEGSITWGNQLFAFDVPYTTPILMDDVDCSGDESSLFNCTYTSDHNCQHYEDIGVICAGHPDLACHDGPIVESVNCSFNLHNCQYKSETTKGDSQWEIGSIAEIYNQDAYMYLIHEEGSARLISPQFNGSEEPMSIEFMYNIINSHYNNLILSLNESTMMPGTGEISSTEYELWNSIYLRSDEDSRWIYHCQDLQTSSDKKYKLIFDGSNFADSLLALDSINVTSRKCKESLLDGKCTFDRPSECGMSIECNFCDRDSYPYRWYWGKHGPTTVPDMLIHVKSIFGDENDKAAVSFKIPFINKRWYLRFLVHMDKYQSGSLTVTLDINNKEFKTIALITGGQGYGWLNWCAKLPDITLTSPYDIAVKFEATRGADIGGMVGDIYLDDIEILTNETCDVSGILDHKWMMTNSSEHYAWMYEDEAFETLRLTNGDSDRGFVEVYHNGEWRGICDDDFGSLDLKVVCRQLGFQDYSYWFNADRYFPFWLSNIQCTGDEENLFDCQTGNWGDTDYCYYYNHVFAVCYGTRTVKSIFFPMNVFYIDDTEVMQGAWAMLTSTPWLNNAYGAPRKFLFDIHKQTSDVLSIWWQDGSYGTESSLLTITKTVEFEKVCVDFSPSEDQFILGINVWKATSSKSKLELTNLEVASGYCQGPIGQEVCDFQSEYVGCKAMVTAMEHGCINQYRWRTVSSLGRVLDYTMKSRTGRFMYISNANGEYGDMSTLEFASLDIEQDWVPFACSVKFVYFLSDGDLMIYINGRSEQLSPITYKPYTWRQGCVMISTTENCPLQSGMVNISFVASGVEAGLDDVHISAETCHTGEDISCEFNSMDDCGYSWTGNFTVTDGVLKNQGEVWSDFAIVSPTFKAEVAELCIAVRNRDYILSYNFSATVIDMTGEIINSTWIESLDNTNLVLNAKTNPGQNYILFIEGQDVYYSSIDLAVDYVRLYDQPCSDVALPCRSSEHTCNNGRCVTNYQICDGNRDCEDGNDEQMCECPSYWDPGFFQCATSGCVRTSLLCDGVADCEDGSDEICEPSLSCTFEDTYFCGYSFYFYNVYSGRITSDFYSGFLAFLESGKVAIEAESCFTVTAEISSMIHTSYLNSIRFIANTTNSLSILGYANLPEERLYNFYTDFEEISITLPVGEYSVIFESQGMHVTVANITLVNGTCPDPTTTALPSTNMPDASTTTSAPSTNSMTTSTIMESLPVVIGTSPMYGLFGEAVDLTCTVTEIGDHEIVTHWYLKDMMISRNDDIMLEDIAQTKYSASRYETDDVIVYTLSVQIGPDDGHHIFSCKVDVIGEPHYDQFDADVLFTVPVPEGDGCVPNQFYACHNAGYSNYKLPSVTGLTNHRQVFYDLMSILYAESSMPSDTCQSLLRDLSCGLHTPSCTELGETLQVCRESCEDIASICLNAYPAIVFNSNEDINYFCKFLPSQEENTCSVIPLECGSEFNTTAKDFYVRSELYPSVPQSPLCTYTFYGPQSLTFFHWFQVSIENLTLDSDCAQSYLKVGDETLCSDAIHDLPKVITVQKNNVELSLARGGTGKFAASFKYDLPWDLCDMKYPTIYDYLVEATSDLQCSRWIFILHPYYQPSYKIKLAIQTLENGCIWVNDNTGADPMEVCAPETVYIQSHNATVTRNSNNITFSLEFALISNKDLEELEGQTEPLVTVGIEIVSFGSYPRNGTGFVRVFRSDGAYGTACYTYGREIACQLAGYLGLASYSYEYELPDGFEYLTSYLDCDGVTSGNVSDCLVSWVDGLDTVCYRPMYLICEVPSVACDFSRGSCGYIVQDEERYTNALSPVFKYTEGTSLKITLFLLGQSGNHGYVSLVKEDDGTEVVLFNPATPIDDIEGHFDLCLPLPNEFVDIDVRLNLSFHYAARSNPSEWLYLTMVELQDKECPRVFPETTCSFDDLLVCEPFIEATCSNSQDRVWKIADGQLNGNAKQGAPLWPYSFTLPLTDVTEQTTKYFHFTYMNNGSFYYQNELNVTVKHYAGLGEVVNWTLGYSQFTVEKCLQVDLVPFVENYLEFELLFNHSLGYVSIDDVMWNDIWCPHPASCDFEQECHMTIGKEANATVWWQVIPAYHEVDHTYQEYGRGHYVSLYDGGWSPVGTNYWFTINKTAIDSRYHCLNFFYKINRYGQESSNVFFSVHANYSTSTESEVKTYGVAEFRDTEEWIAGQVPIITDGPMDDVAFTFVATKLFDDTQMEMFVDDISFESFTCEYGVQNMEVCTFDEPVKCLFSANCTEGSGYLWNIHRESENRYIHVVNSFGDEEDKSHIWFDVNLSAETSDLYYQFYFLSSENAGTLETYLERTEAFWGRRKKREVLGFGEVQLDGRDVWQVSDCYSIPANFVGRIYFLATRGTEDKGHIGIDNVRIMRGSCVEPAISCDFTQGYCGYPITVANWTQSDAGISSLTRGMGLYLPLHKLQYQEACLNFDVQLKDMMSALMVIVASENKTEFYRFGHESGSNFTGQVNISSGDIRSVQFMLPPNTGDTIRSVAIYEGLCSLTTISCGDNYFQCEEKCIKQERRCNTEQDCYSGNDEDSCGFSLECTFGDGNTCSYEDVSEHSLWHVQDNFTFSDEDGVQQTITPEGNDGLLFAQFEEYSLVHAELKTIPSVVHSDSCLVFAYAGTVSKLKVTITYDDRTLIEWQDTAVKCDTLDWKPAMIDIAPGHVSALFDTSMITREDNLPKLLKGSFLAIDDIVLENQRCADIQPLDCPNGTVLCADRSMCYSEAWLCDGTEYCPDGSDESVDYCSLIYTLDCTFEETCYYFIRDENTNSYWTKEQAFLYELPQYDHTYRNKSGHFLYLSEPFSFNGIAYNATMESAMVVYDTDVCVSFWYFMNSTRWQTNSLTAQIFVTVVYTDGLGMSHNLLWYDSADRYIGDWIQGNVPIQANRTAKLWVTGKTFNPAEVWPGMVAIDDIEVTEGPCPITQECRPGSFECTATSVCIPGYYRCDGTMQCYDGSDEESCNKPDNVIDLIGGEGSYGQARVFLDSVWHPVCLPSFSSHNLALGICRNQGFNGLAETFVYYNPDTSQTPVELNCTEDGDCVSALSACYEFLGVRCSNDVCFYAYGHCPGTRDQCIPDGRFCDGLQDCFENTDEMNCAECNPETEMECLNHDCVPIEARCNGTSECSDGSDELRCIQIEDGRVTVWVGDTAARKPVCYSNDMDRITAERLCRLSGSGYLQVSELWYGPELIPDGVRVIASEQNSEGTLLPGLDFMDGPLECRPLNLTCKLPECGTTAAMEDSLQPLITFGEEAALGEWPWHCALFHSGRFACGAAYIGDAYFMTAAHCLDNVALEILTVKCGTIELSDLGPYGIEYTISRHWQHPEYDGVLSEKTTDNYFDIGLMKTSTPPITDNFTRPICLGNAEEWQRILDLGDQAVCYAAGFGDTEQDNIDNEHFNERLRETRVTIHDLDECEKYVTEDLEFWIYNDTLCMQNTNPYSPLCSGDSGSAIVCKDTVSGRWKQFALVSVGFVGCDSHYLPDFPNAVYPYLDWISSVTGLDFTTT